MPFLNPHSQGEGLIFFVMGWGASLRFVAIRGSATCKISVFRCNLKLRSFSGVFGVVDHEPGIHF